MQFLNRFNDPRNPKLKLVVIGSIIFGVLIAILLVVSVQNNKSSVSKPGSYYDEGSGETVSNPAGKTPEKFGSNSASPIFLGFDDLLNVGVTSQQLAAIKQAFNNYSLDGNKDIKEISLFITTIKRLAPNRDTNDYGDVVTFDIKIDREQLLSAKVESTSVKVSRLYLYKNGGQLVFDSNDVDAGIED